MVPCRVVGRCACACFRVWRDFRRSNVVGSATKDTGNHVKEWRDHGDDRRSIETQKKIKMMMNEYMYR